MSLAKMDSLRTAAAADPTKATLEALLAEEMALLSRHYEAVTALQQRRQTAAKRKVALLVAIEGLRNDQNGQPIDAASPVPDATKKGALSPSEYQEYRLEYIRLLKDFTQRKRVLTYFLSFSVSDLKLADLRVVSQWLDTWGVFFAAAEASCKELKHRERGASNAHLLPTTKHLYTVLDDMCRLQLQARSLVGRERYRRSAFGDESVDSFLENQSLLYDWVDGQRTTLASLTGMDDLVEFSSSFYANAAVMDSNFLVLMEQYEKLMENPQVQEAMSRLNEAWVELSLETYEKLRTAARATHAKSHLEDDCATWVQDMGPRLQSLLATAAATLVRKGVANGLPSKVEAIDIVAKCNRALKDHGAYHLVCVHLADYGIREDCIQPHLEAIKRELRSRMTSTVLSLPSAAEYECRQEYMNRIEELREWIDVKSQKATYARLLERLDGMKQMIDESADALFPENDD